MALLQLTIPFASNILDLSAEIKTVFVIWKKWIIPFNQSFDILKTSYRMTKVNIKNESYVVCSLLSID